MYRPAGTPTKPIQADSNYSGLHHQIDSKLNEMLSKEELLQWAMQVQSAESARDRTREIQAPAEAGAHTLWEARGEHVTELTRLRSSGSGVPPGVSDSNGIRGSHHYFLDLTTEEARMVVVFCHGIFFEDIVNLSQAYKDVHKLDKCLCNACMGFGHVYSVFSPCELTEKTTAHRPAAQRVAVLIDVVPIPTETSNPHEAPMETKHMSAPMPASGTPAEGPGVGD